jgi:Asp-tRNA(Asn)/Glu-tRNA(Gln) amidotransferase A subunit family amidase
MKALFTAILSILVMNSAAQSQEFDAFEKTIPELQAAMQQGRITSVELVRQYLDRIEAFDQNGPKINSMIYVNPNAMAVAEALDRERAASGARGPLHGVPIVLKDNYDTEDMPTTGGTLALANHIPPDDGFQVRKLREAGAIIIGKTNLHELARGIETIGSMGGQTLNPYDPARNPGGSSGGTGAAVAANFASVGMGSDTCGSIRIPSANNDLFGLRVTQGLSSRDGIIPLSHTQDVGGPLARSMIDLALVLDATVGVDPADPQTVIAEGRIPASFAALENENALEGLRLGLLTARLSERSPYGEMTSVVKEAIAKMVEQGAETVDIEIDGLDELTRTSGVIGMEANADLDEYLEDSNAPVKSMDEILDSGHFHAALEQRFRNPLGRDASMDDYDEYFGNRMELAAAIDTAMTANDIDVIVFPTLGVKPMRVEEGQFGSSCQIAAHSGFPAISMPAGFTPDGVPVGIEVVARPFEDSRLVSIGFAYEKIADTRRPPQRTPSLVSDPLVYEFDFESSSARGELHLDRPTQTLHYDFRLAGIRDDEILMINLHRATSGSNGPVIDLLGRSRSGSVAVRNEDLDDLLNGGIYLAVYTRDKPTGAARAQIVRGIR